ncbi:MAG: phosphoribosylformylglycinamidine synthase subunit PurL [Acidimicrobiales bacterium]
MEPAMEPAPGPRGHRQLGLTDDEAADIERILGRRPNHLELAMYAVMWSEHCSYKSSRAHLRRLPSEGAGVLVGPGENAGVVDAGDGLAVAIRIESHNHPSAIEPYQGAATGVGGIIRDIFTMGARPVALMDALRFGPPAEARNRWVATGVVSGISGYGNAVGVPTVGGELEFADCYAGNPLVNVLCCGVLPKERLVLGRAAGEGNLAVLLGSTTGRDGIGGVSVLASASFGDDAEAEAAKRPNVQVGDPYEEKRLIEATLELLDRHLVVGIQDLGGAGLTCAASETASRGAVGMDVNVLAVPLREPAMEPYEVMTSESQERMLAIVTPGALAAVTDACRRWEVRATVVGRVTGTGRLRVLAGWDGRVLADVPAASLGDDAPVYQRPLRRPAGADERAADDPAELPPPSSSELVADLLAMLADPGWAFRQYDHQLFLNTVVAPGADAAVRRLSAPGARPPSGAGTRGLALSTDGNPRWCALDPRTGTALLVAESALNVACAGARPVALVNCLNFGNPEHPEVMWELSEAVDGMAEACRALGIPVVGGNVSLYNETNGVDIDPTPVVGTLGLIDRLRPGVPVPALADGSQIVLLGPDGPGAVSLAGSRWARERRAHLGGHLPLLDLALHRRLLTLVAELVDERLVDGAHDVSDGGVGVALAEMAVKGGTGCRVGDFGDHQALFGEGPSRVLMSVPPANLGQIRLRAAAVGIAWRDLGAGGGDRFVVEGLADIDLEELVAAWKATLPTIFSTL